MANNWQNGELGLQYLSAVNSTFNETVDSFNDNVDSDYTNLSIPSNPSFANESYASSSIYTDITNPGNPTFSSVGGSSASFSDVSNPSEPTYDNVGVNY